MLKNKTVLEIKIEDRVYTMECDPASPLGELHDVLTRMKFYVLDRMQEEQKRDEQRSQKFLEDKDADSEHKSA